MERTECIRSFYNILYNKKPKSIPFIPRFDLWYNTHSRKKLKPKILENIGSSNDFYRSMKFIPYSNVPDFIAYGDIQRTLHRALGFYDLGQSPWKIRFEKVKYYYKVLSDSIYIKYETPIGSVDTEFLNNEKTIESQASISWIKKKILKSKEDYKILEYIFEDMIVEEKYKEFDDFIKEQGESWIPISYAVSAVSGVHHLLRELLDPTEFYVHLNDYKKEVIKIGEIIDKKIKNIIDICSKCSSDIVFVGGNFDSMLTFPPFYKEYILPQFSEWTKTLHENNKKVISHCDGENKSLWELELKSGIDIFEAICVSPMVEQSLEDITDIIRNKAILWGGINSISLIEESMDLDNFKLYIENTINIAKNNRIILGVADTAPINMDISRIEYIRDRISSQ